MNRSSPTLSLVTLLALGACAAPPVAKVAAPPPSYLEMVAERVQANQGSPVYEIRHNPTSRACPTYEVLLGAAWHRVILEAETDDEVMTILAARLEESRETGRLATHPIQGALQGGVELCGKGVAVVTLEPSGYGRPPEEEPPSPDPVDLKEPPSEQP